MGSQKIYVLRAEDESCTKIGRSFNPSMRCTSITLSEKKKYYLLYESKMLVQEEAIRIETLIVNQFKEDNIKGYEWLNTHPLDVIRFIISLIGIPKLDDNPFNMGWDCKFDYWLVANTKFNSAYEFEEYIRISGNTYIAYVKLVHNCRFITVAFANIGNAKSFVSHFKHKIIVIDKIIPLLYGITYEEWADKQINLKHLGEWRLI